MNKRQEQPQIQGLRWFLEFISMDIQGMSERDFAKLLIDAEYYFDSRWPLIATDEFAEGWSPGDSVRSPTWMQEFPEVSDWRQVLTETQGALQGFLVRDFLKNPGDGLLGPIVWKGQQAKASIAFSVYDGEGLLLFRYDSLKQGDPDEIPLIAKMNLAFLLNHIPTEAVRCCPECNKYFLHLSERNKKYCNAKCASRAVARKHREADPEAYRTKQRERYRSKAAKKFGKSPEKIKIQRRRSKTT